MNFMKLPKIVLFDLDGVILDTESVYIDLLLNYNKINDMPLTKDYYIRNILGKTKNEIGHILEEEFKDKYNFKDYWEGLEKYRDNYLNNNKIRIKDGFLSLIDYLNNNNYLTGLVTSNSSILVNKLLENAGLDSNIFKVIITRDQVDKTKPAPDLYLKALDFFKEDKSNCIAIEDSNVGINAALNAGINVIYLKDIDIIDIDIESKCSLSMKSLEEIYMFFKEME